jgi:predicted dehydrogenase
MRGLRVGIVGCGEVTQILHLPALDQLHEQYSITALCDVSNHTLQAIGDYWRIGKRYLDYRDLIDLPDVDVVLVANPNAYHAEVTLAAIAAGKHVLVEKPMCVTLREADEITVAQAKHNVIVQVGTMRRYAPAFIKACELLKQLGSVRMARVHDVLGSNSLFIENTSRVIRGKDVPDDVLAQGMQLNDALTREAIGETSPELQRAYSLMLGLSTHDTSAMRELLGMPKRVIYAAQHMGGLYLTAAFDYGDFVCHFETGINHIARFDAGLTVYGDKQILNVRYNTPYVRNLPICVTLTEANSSGGVIDRAEHPSWGDAFVSEWQAFYANVLHQHQPKTHAADFRQDLELFRDMIAAMR